MNREGAVPGAQEAHGHYSYSLDSMMHVLTGSTAFFVTVHSLCSGPWWPFPWCYGFSAQ